jgi:hypothetical protein
MGRKNDKNKIRWSLMPFNELEEVAEVFMFGADKYTDFGWKTVPNARERYWNACMRHLLSGGVQNAKDPESNLRHLAHLICSALIVMWHDTEGVKNGTTKKISK